VIGVVSHSVARLYRRFGLDLRDIGVGTAPGCANIVACSIDLDPAAFHKLQCDPVTLLKSITRVGQLPLADPGVPGHSHPTEASAPAATCPSQFGTTERGTHASDSLDDRPLTSAHACRAAMVPVVGLLHPVRPDSRRVGLPAARSISIPL
jgi:hypothetical protein